MAIAEVSSMRVTAHGGAFNSQATAYPSNVTTGDLLITAGAIWNPSSSSFTVGVTDSRSTSYTVLLGSPVAQGSDFYRTFLAYGTAPSSGACTVTINPSPASNYGSWSLDAFSGVDTSTPLDVDGLDTTGTSTTPSDTLTTTTANALLIGSCVHNNGSDLAIGAGINYTQFGEWEGVADGPHNAVFRLVTSATSYTVDWTLAASVLWGAQTAAFKEASAGGGTTSHLLCLTGVGQ